MTAASQYILQLAKSHESDTTQVLYEKFTPTTFALFIIFFTHKSHVPKWVYKVDFDKIGQYHISIFGQFSFFTRSLVEKTQVVPIMPSVNYQRKKAKKKKKKKKVKTKVKADWFTTDLKEMVSARMKLAHLTLRTLR